MPQDSMDWWIIAGVIVAVATAAVAFMRRPKKTTNTIKDGSGNIQTGGDGTTSNEVERGNDNNQSG